MKHRSFPLLLLALGGAVATAQPVDRTAERMAEALAARVISCSELESGPASPELRSQIEGFNYRVVASAALALCDASAQAGPPPAPGAPPAPAPDCPAFVATLGCDELGALLVPDTSAQQPFTNALGTKILDCYAEEGLIVDDQVRAVVSGFTTAMAESLVLLARSPADPAQFQRGAQIVSGMDCAALGALLHSDVSEMIRALAEAPEGSGQTAPAPIEGYRIRDLLGAGETP